MNVHTANCDSENCQPLRYRPTGSPSLGVVPRVYPRRVG
jgi:hypothetical protein